MGDYIKIADNKNNTTSQNNKFNRLLSLDLFRGISIFAMILVNTSAFFPDNFSPLIESEWNGTSPADCIFPSFLFIMG